jgi:hypothetical protein
LKQAAYTGTAGCLMRKKVKSYINVYFKEEVYFNDKES